MSAMPHPAPDHGERDRAAFERWHFGSDAVVGAETYDREDKLIQTGFLAGAAHGRADADERVERCAELNRYLRSEREQLQSALRDARNEAESAREQAAKLEKLRDLASNAAGFLTDRIDAAEDALPEGFRVDAEHNLAECIEALAADRDYWRKQGLAANLEAGRLKLEHGACATPPPDSALRERVVEAAMDERMLRRSGRVGDALSRAARARDAACDALAAATPKPTDALRDAAGRLRAMAGDDNPLGTVSVPPSDPRDTRVWIRRGDILDLADALDAARAERKGGGE